jgi:WD repeat-containing protein 59
MDRVCNFFFGSICAERSVDAREFQLITWDRDSVLRFWPIDTNIMEKVGYRPKIQRNFPRTLPESFRDHLEAHSNPTSAITAPTHQSGVLKSVKAPKTRRAHPSTTEPSSLPVGSASPIDHFRKPSQQSSTTTGVVQGHNYSNMTMGKGHGRAARPHLDPMTWYSAVEEDTRRSESVDTGSSPVRKSTSRPRAGVDSLTGRPWNQQGRSGSQVPDNDADPEPRSLKEE